MTPYILKGYHGDELKEIRRAHQDEISIDKYLSHDLYAQQLHEIRIGLKDGLDVDIYAKPLFSHQQMKEIRLGLEAGIDVTEYAKLICTAKEMKRIRKELTDSKEAKAALEIKKIEDSIQDTSQAYNKTQIEEIVGKSIISKKILIAEGIPPEKGEDGWYEYFVDVDKQRVPKPEEDGSVDFTKVESFHSVQKGEAIAYYHKAEAGKEGYNVYGEVVPGEKGKELSPIKGYGFGLLPEKATYVALKTGRVEVVNENLVLSPVLELKEDVTAVTGKIVFDGTVHIFGAIHSGGYVESAADVIVEQYMESGTIKAKGNVLIKQGARSKNQCVIYSGGNVSGNFFEAVNIDAEGNLQANSIINSIVDVGGEVTVSGRKGVLMGGSVAAMKGVFTQNLGNEVHIVTKLDLGYNKRAEAKALDLKNK